MSEHTIDQAAAAEPSALTIFHEEIERVLDGELGSRLGFDDSGPSFFSMTFTDKIVAYVTIQEAIAAGEKRPYLLRLAEAMRFQAERIEAAFEAAA